MFMARVTRTHSAKAVILMAFTETHRVISGWVAGAALWTGSMNEAGSSNTTNTSPMIPIAYFPTRYSHVSMKIEAARLWVGQVGGLSRFDPVTEKFINYRNNPADPASLGNGGVSAIYQDRSGTVWFGTWIGTLSRFDEHENTFVRPQGRLA